MRRKRGRRGRGGERAVFSNLPCPPHLHLQTCLHQAYDEYMISDYDLLPSRYVSVPKSYGSFNPGGLVAGIVRGMLDTAGSQAR